jgi:hypothetical protein
MDTSSKVIPLHQAHPEPSGDMKSGDLDSGSLDSGFFCELNGVTTQFPHKSGSLSSDLGGNLVPFRDEPEVGENDVEAQRTNIPLHKQGKTKTLFMAGLVAVPMLGVGYSMFGGSGEPAKTVQVPAEAPPPKPTTKDFAPDPRFAVAQSKLAMQQQEQQLLAAATAQKAAEAQKASTPAATPPTENPNAAVAATLPKPSTAQTKTTPVTAAPVPITDNTPTNVQPPLLPPPTITAQPKAYTPPKVYTPPVREIAKQPPAKPYLIANRGIAITPPTPRLVPKVAAPVIPASKPKLVATSTPKPPITPVSWQQATQNGVAVFGVRGEPTQVAQAAPQVAPARANPVASNPARMAVPGQNRSITLITPLQILGGESQQETLISLDREFIDTKGGTLIPARTMISAQILVADNGMLRIGSAKAIIDGVEHPIEAGNLMISGMNNDPLLAQMKKFGGDEIGKRDLGTFFMGALQGIGKVLTTPDTQSQVTASGTAISTTTNKPNLVGGVLDGGASPLIQAWVTRNEAEIKRIEGATRIWFLPAGTKMNLLTTKAFGI